MESSILQMNIISNPKSFKANHMNYKSLIQQHHMMLLKWDKQDKFLLEQIGMT